MSSSNISLILPLVDAQRSQKTGNKATNLSKLIAARFAVPKGFVISADAYRSHLWASGARSLASAADEAEDREKVRTAILSAEVPDDIWSAIIEAYQRLSWQLGYSDPKVAVRSSALEGKQLQESFSGAYESYLNVSGLDELRVAVKRVWASLWTGKAAAYRMKSGVSSEPAMAVIIQQMIDISRKGSALTADPMTGDPHNVLISTEVNGVFQRYKASLRDISVECEDAGQEDAAHEAVAVIAEKAILVESAISSPLEMEWALENDVLWILQATPLKDLPPYFPVTWTDETDANAQWQRVTDKPVSCFAKSLLWKSQRGINGPFSVNSGMKKSCQINGYIYTHIPEASIQQADKNTAQRLLTLWDREIERDLKSRCEDIIKAKPKEADHARLQRMLLESADVVRTAADWVDYAWNPSTRFSALLKDIIKGTTGDNTLYHKLIKGLPDTTIFRDTRLQEFGERFRAAEDTGKLSDEKWWHSYRHDVAHFAHEHGYSFKSKQEMCDPLTWKSWIEDTDAVFRIISAMTRLDGGPSLVTRHDSSEQEAAIKAKEAEELVKSKVRGFGHFLQLSRRWLAKRNEIEQVYALACAALKLVLVEMSRRLKESGLLVEGEDIQFLTLGELASMPKKIGKSKKAEIAGKILERKHQLWLEQRLHAPQFLPIGSECQSNISSNTFEGCAASPGTATGCIRLVDTLAEAAEIEKGDILVTRAPKLTWTPFLALAGGFISEEGPDIMPFALEYDIPAVTGCKGILNAVRDGQRVSIDGSQGAVTLH